MENLKSISDIGLKLIEMANAYKLNLNVLPNGYQFKGNRDSVSFYPTTGTITKQINGKTKSYKKAGFEKLGDVIEDTFVKPSLNNTYAEIEQVRKEYLDSAKNYTYVQDTAKRSKDWIEIPEGAEVATFNVGQLVFWKNNGELSYSMDFSSYWERSEDGLSTLKEYTDYYGDHVVWSRYTQPDPLPFIDDEPQNATELRTSNENSTAHTNPQKDANNATNANAWQSQVGGDHYKKLKIQPMEYALANKLDYAQANVVKYVTRHADKNGKEDLLKAIHNIQLMIEHYYAD